MSEPNRKRMRSNDFAPPVLPQYSKSGAFQYPLGENEDCAEGFRREYDKKTQQWICKQRSIAQRRATAKLVAQTRARAALNPKKVKAKKSKDVNANGDCDDNCYFPRNIKYQGIVQPRCIDARNIQPFFREAKYRQAYANCKYVPPANPKVKKEPQYEPIQNPQMYYNGQYEPRSRSRSRSSRRSVDVRDPYGFNPQQYPSVKGQSTNIKGQTFTGFDQGFGQGFGGGSGGSAAFGQRRFMDTSGDQGQRTAAASLRSRRGQNLQALANAAESGFDVGNFRPLDEPLAMLT